MLRKSLLSAVCALAIATGAAYAAGELEFPELRLEIATSLCSERAKELDYSVGYVRAYNACLDSLKSEYYSAKMYWEMTTSAQHTSCLKYAEQQKQTIQRKTNWQAGSSTYQPTNSERETVSTKHYYASLSACLEVAYGNTPHQW
jgi:hypothetical protein